MKILVVGDGAVGAILCKLLVKEKQIEEVYCCDLQDHKRFTNTKVKFHKVNVKNKQEFNNFLNKIKPNIVVNAAHPILNVPILEACLKNKTNYLDMAAWWDLDPNKKAISPYKIEQLDFHNSFKKNNLIGLIEAGVSPGMTNLLAAECADQINNLDYIKIRLIEYSGTNQLYFAWSKEALLDEINSKPLIYQNGKFKIVEPFSGEEQFEFPRPFGKKTTVLLCQDEVGTIPFYLKTKNVDVKAYDNQGQTFKMLYDLGLTSEDEITLNNTEISPLEFTAKVLPNIPKTYDKKYDNAQFAFVVQGLGKNKKISYSALFPKQSEINKFKIDGNFISYPTAICAKLFVLAMSEMTLPGVYPPEAIESSVRKKLIEELKKHCVLKKY